MDVPRSEEFVSVQGISTGEPPVIFSVRKISKNHLQNHTRRPMTQILLRSRSWKEPSRASLSHNRDKSKNLHFHRLSEFFQKSLHIFGIDIHRWAFSISFLSVEVNIKCQNSFELFGLALDHFVPGVLDSLFNSVGRDGIRIIEADFSLLKIHLNTLNPF